MSFSKGQFVGAGVWQLHTVDDNKWEFIALKEKGSTNEVSIYFFWRDTDKIKSVKHGRHEVSGFWR